MSDIQRGTALRKIESSDAEAIASIYAENQRHSADGVLADPEHWRGLAESKASAVYFKILNSNGDMIGLAPIYQVNSKQGYAYSGVYIFAPDARGNGLGYTAKLLQLKFAFEHLKLNGMRERISNDDASLIDYLCTQGFSKIGDAPEGYADLEITRDKWQKLLQDNL